MQKPNPVIKNYIISSEIFYPDIENREFKTKISDAEMLYIILHFGNSLCHKLSVQNKD